MLSMSDERNSLKNRCFSIKSDYDFFQLALDIYHLQKEHNEVYKRYLSLIGKNRIEPKSIAEIPCLPIEFFKKYKVKTGEWESKHVFRSSGTTGSTRSYHYVSDLDFYTNNARKSFEAILGSLDKYCVLGLLPSYLERNDSSLVAMVSDFINYSGSDQSGFYLDDWKGLYDTLRTNKSSKVPTILFGVSFALIDFVGQFGFEYSDLIVIETGGMKGRKRELTKQEQYKIIKSGFEISRVYSEYGMTELFSQSYTTEVEGLYRPIRTKKVLATEIQDPFQQVKEGKTGVINVIDLANVDSCSFIATQDLGRVFADGSFELLGRIDYSELRGCNLLLDNA